MKDHIISAVSQIDTRKDIFWGAVALIGMCACMYMYLVTVTVRNIVTNRQLSAQISNVGEQLSAKEFSLISMKNGVTMDYAQTLGFAEAKEKVFITPTSVSVVSTNTQGNTI